MRSVRLVRPASRPTAPLRVPRTPQAARRGRWQRLDASVAGLTAADYTLVDWPRHSDDDPRQVYVPVVSTRIRPLYRRQVVIARLSLESPASTTHYWASSELDGDLPTLRGHIAARWDVEGLFTDTKEVLGLDQCQLITTLAIVRFWTPVLAVYTLLEEAQARLARAQQRHVTIGEARRSVPHVHQHHRVHWIAQQRPAGTEVNALYTHLAA